MKRIFFLLFCVAGIFAAAPPQGDLQERLYGADKAQITDYPFVASVYADRKQNCAGVIITKLILLSNALCFATLSQYKDGTWGVSLDTYRVRVGESKLNGSGKAYAPAAILRHPDFVTANRQDATKYAIAIIMLRYPLEFSDTVGKISINCNQEIRRRSATVLGFGKATSDSNPDEEGFLRMLDTQALPVAECKQASNSSSIAVLNDNNMCTQSAKGKGLCRRDGGDPLVGLNARGKNCLLGIASYAIDYCGSDSPEIFTKVSAFCPWIQESIQSLEQKMVDGTLVYPQFFYFSNGTFDESSFDA